MDLPWTTLIGVSLLWLGIGWAYSLLVALVVADSAGRPKWQAVALGVLVPVVGPLIWGCIEYVRLKKVGYTSRTPIRGGVPSLTGVIWWAAAGLLAVALFFPWLRAEAAVDGRFEGDLSPTPMDTVVGSVALGGVAIALVLGGLVVGWAARRRLALLLGGVGALLLATSLSSVIAYQRVSSAGTSIAGWAGHTVRGDLVPGPALWITLGASVLIVAGSLSALLRGARGAVGVPAPVPAAVAPESAGWASSEGTGGW